MADDGHHVTDKWAVFGPLHSAVYVMDCRWPGMKIAHSNYEQPCSNWRHGRPRHPRNVPFFVRFFTEQMHFLPIPGPKA
jgi:hypothetical protein